MLDFGCGPGRDLKALGELDLADLRPRFPRTRRLYLPGLPSQPRYRVDHYRNTLRVGGRGNCGCRVRLALQFAVAPTPELGSLTAQLRETRGESCRALLTADVSSRMHATTDTVP